LARQRIVEIYRNRMARYMRWDGMRTLPADADAIERSLRLVGLHAERDEILQSGGGLGIPEVLLRRLTREVDLQEARHSS